MNLVILLFYDITVRLQAGGLRATLEEHQVRILKNINSFFFVFCLRSAYYYYF